MSDPSVMQRVLLGVICLLCGVVAGYSIAVYRCGSTNVDNGAVLHLTHPVCGCQVTLKPCSTCRGIRETWREFR